ncbi:MAG TPA: hypothetical protein VL326_26265 [Kofleriaceae bacterium]|nr:hypothetical protein [Kofleriaceae bacterium]
MRSLLGAIVALGVLLGVAKADNGQPLDPFDAAHGSNERGTVLFEKGRALLKEGKLDDACIQFDESWRIERALGTQLNLANCREHQGKLVEAFDLFTGAAEAAAAQHDDMRRDFALSRAYKLEHQLALITINLATPVVKGTIVTIDGEVVPTQPTIERRVDPHKLVVAATGPTGVLSSAELKLSAGGEAMVWVPTLEERPRRIKKTRLIAGAAIIALGVGTCFLNPWLGSIPIGIGVFTMLTTETERGPVVAKPRVSTGP